MRLGGTMILHNPLKYDYCVQESILSLCRVCDEVVILNCQSNDGTAALLTELQTKHDNLFVFDGNWEIAADKERLSILTNQATEHLSNDIEWLYNLQADEVFLDTVLSGGLKTLIESCGNTYDAISSRRINLWGSFERYFPDSGYCRGLPCSNTVIRLVKRSCKSLNDAESFGANQCYHGAKDMVQIVHYGFLRNPRIMLGKCIDMQTWFGMGVDRKLLEQQVDTGVFNSEAWHRKQDLKVWKGTHPSVMHGWIKERRRFYND